MCESTIRLHKKPLFRIFLIQYGQILGFEAGLILSYNYVDFNFILFQLLLAPIFIILLISKYNKSITTIEIDYNNKIFKIEQNYFLLTSKNIEMPFNNVSINLKWKWLLYTYNQVIEIRDNGRLIAVLPFIKGSIWNRDELNRLLFYIKELEKRGEVKASIRHESSHEVNN